MIPVSKWRGGHDVSDSKLKASSKNIHSAESSEQENNHLPPITNTY
ncbi:hypothetical protein QS817_06525 [Providencia rettgeri]|nr:hypothetical protein [Providencia rettgeri]MDL9982867.1 hypothetical protein [Providencia rettgeri]